VQRPKPSDSPVVFQKLELLRRIPEFREQCGNRFLVIRLPDYFPCSIHRAMNGAEMFAPTMCENSVRRRFLFRHSGKIYFSGTDFPAIGS